MHNNTIKFYRAGKARTIICLVGILLFLIGFIALMVVEYNAVGALVVFGGIMSLIFIVVILYVLFSPFYVKLDADSVTEINAFGKIKKTHELKSLKEIRITCSYSIYWSVDYLYFNFSEKDYSDYEVKDLVVEDDITLLAYSEKTIAIIKEFTDVPIIDMRKKRKKR